MEAPDEEDSVLYPAPQPKYDAIAEHLDSDWQKRLPAFDRPEYADKLRELCRPRDVCFSSSDPIDSAMFASIIGLHEAACSKLQKKSFDKIPRCCRRRVADKSRFRLLDPWARVPAESESASFDDRTSDSVSSSSSCSSSSSAAGSPCPEAGETVGPFGKRYRSSQGKMDCLEVCSAMAAALVLAAILDANSKGNMTDRIPSRVLSWLMSGTRGARFTLHDLLSQETRTAATLALSHVSRWFNPDYYMADVDTRAISPAPHVAKMLKRRSIGRSEATKYAERMVCPRAVYPNPDSDKARALAITRPQATRAVYYAFVAWEFFSRGRDPPSGRFDVHELAAILEAMCTACTCMEPTVLIGGPRVPDPKERAVASHSDINRCELGPNHKHGERAEFCAWTYERPSRSLASIAEFKKLGPDAKRLWALHALARYSIYHGESFLGKHPGFEDKPAERLCNRFPMLVEGAALSARELGLHRSRTPTLIPLEVVPFEELFRRLELRPGTRALVRRFYDATSGIEGRHSGMVLRGRASDANSLASFVSQLIGPESHNIKQAEVRDRDPPSRIVRIEQSVYLICPRWVALAARALSVYRVVGPKKCRGAFDSDSLKLNAEHIMLEYLRGDVHELHFAMKLLWKSVCYKSSDQSRQSHASRKLGRVDESMEAVGGSPFCPRDFYRHLHRLVARAVRGCGTTLREHVASIWTRVNAHHWRDMAGPREGFGQPVRGFEFERMPKAGPGKQIRNDRMRAHAIVDSCRVPFILRGLQSFLEMRLPHYIDWDLARELVANERVRAKRPQLHAVLSAGLLSGREAVDRSGMDLPLTVRMREFEHTYTHWLLYEICLDREAVSDEVAYRIFCRTLTRSGFALRSSPDDPPDRKHPNIDFDDEPEKAMHAKPFYHLPDSERASKLRQGLKDEQMEERNRVKKTIRPEKRFKHGRKNRSARYSAEEEDELFARHARPCAGRKLAIKDATAADFACLWELVQIVCSEERVTLTPCRARLLLDVPLGSDYKYVTEHGRPDRSQTLFALFTNDHTGLPPSLPRWTFAAHCNASEVRERMEDGGRSSLFGVLDDSVAEACVFDGGLPHQPILSSGFNDNRLPPLGALLPADILLRILRMVDEPENLERVCTQWKLLIERHVLHRV